MFHRFALARTTLSLIGAVGLFVFSVVAVSSTFVASPVQAATVTSGTCTATVDNATGVTMAVASNGDCVLSFATAATTPTTGAGFATRTWTVPSSVSSVDGLVVAGGGGGGMSNGSTPSGGGGGGGGIVLASGLSVTASSSITVTTGFGGQGGNCSPGSRGGNSTFGTLTAVGGGFGGGCGPAYGGPGGNAGGAHWGQAQGFSNQATSGTASNGSNITAYGNAGGKSYPHGVAGDSVSAGGGGGGGATGDGGNATQPGDVNTGIGGAGGQGIANTWRSGSAVIYGSGGGGQGRGTQGVGGTNAGTGSGTNAAGNPGIDAVDETGAGGGGGYRQGGGRAGDGGSGIVVVRYSIPGPPSSLAIPVITGTARTGDRLTTSNGSWTGTPTSYVYQWKRASTSGGSYSNIPSATDRTYDLTDADIDKFIKVSVIATNSLGSSSAELSASTSIVVDLADPVVPTATSPIATATGFTFTILNYSNMYTYSLTSSKGTVSRSVDDVTVTGLAAGESATVTISITRNLYKPASKTVTGTAIPAPVVVIDIQAPVNTVAQGQESVVTIAPTVSTVAPPAVVVATTTTIANANSVAVKNVPTTTVASLASPTNSIPPPVIPNVSTGESALNVGGVSTKVELSRQNNQLVMQSGTMKAVLSGLDDKGATRSLDSDGNLRLTGGDVVKLNVGGFKPGSTVDIWLFSTPQRLGTAKVGADGRMSGSFTIPKNVEEGPHRIAITAKLPNGKSATFTLGIAVGEIARTSTLTRVLIAIPIVLAIGFGLILPNQLRRRRKALTI